MNDRQLPQEGEAWRHYKGGLYHIIGIGQQEADNSLVVVYKSLKDSKIYTRPVSEFMEAVETGYRFEKEYTAPSDLACFIDLYNRFGVKLKVDEHEGHQYVFLPCSSMAVFDKDGKFISQSLIG